MDAALFHPADSRHQRPGVEQALSRLGKHEKKLFRWMPDGEAALGASVSTGGLQPSYLLGKLVAAIGALDWPEVIILVHDAIPDKGSIAPSKV